MNLESGFPATRQLTSIIVPWAGRSELPLALEKNRAMLSRPGRELIVVSQGDVSVVSGILAAANIPSTVLLQIPDPNFNKCSCLNVGVAFSHGSRVFLLDCDIVVSEEAMCTAEAALEEDAFVTFAEGLETQPAGNPQILPESHWLQSHRTITQLVLGNGAKVEFDLWSSKSGRSLCGLMLIHKDHYIAVEGSNSELQGWGFEDFDLQIRLQAKLGLKRRSLGTALHLSHGRSPDLELAKTHTRNRDHCFDNYRNNRLLGTYPADLARLGPEVQQVIGACVRSEPQHERTYSLTSDTGAAFAANT